METKPNQNNTQSTTPYCITVQELVGAATTFLRPPTTQHRTRDPGVVFLGQTSSPREVRRNTRYAAVRLRRLFFHFDRARGTCETTCRRRLTTTRVCERRSRSRRSKHSWKARKQLRQRNQLVGRILRTRLLRGSRGDKRAETRQRCGHAPSTETTEVCHKAKQHNTRERINSDQNPYVN